MKSLFLATLSIAGGVLFAGLALADDTRVIVGFKDSPSLSLLEREGGTVHHASGRVVAVTLPAAAVARLRREAEVAYVEEDVVVEALGDKVVDEGKGRPGGGTTPPPQQTPWGVDKVGAPLAWGRTKGHGVEVVVNDTGIDLDHPDLALNVHGGVNYVRPGAAPDDDNGHGSHVAGTIAAVDNAVGYVGVAPQAYLYAVKSLDRRGSGYTSDVAAGVDWARLNSKQVVNMSLGSSASTTTMETACDEALAAGLVLVAAAGNSGDGDTSTPEWSYPAAYASVISVGATWQSDALASFSNTNSDVYVSAPGVYVPSTYKNGGYATLSGTSMASPHVAGFVALLLGDGVAAADVPAALQANVDDLGEQGWDSGFGWGRIYWKR